MRCFERQTASRLILGMCFAEVLNMLGVFTFPALLPRFSADWNLSNTEAGWISGIYFAGYTVAVPVLASLTDRVDARRIYLLSASIAVMAALGFALFADGLWTALVFRALGGLGLAGTFIPGLKMLVDRLDGSAQARAIPFYTASFSLGTGLSFLVSGELGAWVGWRGAFLCASAGALLALLFVGAIMKPRAVYPRERPDTFLLDFRPVLSNREAMSYILAYAAHTWELFSVRSWMVAFLAFSVSLQAHGEAHWNPSSVVALAILMAMWASVGGAELSIRFDRYRTLTIIMIGSALFACGFGFTASLSYPLVATLCVVYMLFVQGDSAALHTGAVQAATPNQRGATMAVQSLLGFGSAAVGPMVVGMILDITGGGKTVSSWGAAFITMGVGVGMGPLFLALLGPRSRHPSKTRYS